MPKEQNSIGNDDVGQKKKLIDYQKLVTTRRKICCEFCVKVSGLIYENYMLYKTKPIQLWKL